MTVRDPDTLRSGAQRSVIDGIVDALRGLYSKDATTGGAIIVGSAALLHVRDEKASGTNGGTFTQGDWRTRDLNTVVTNEIAGASLASNQITLPAGTYDIEASAPGQFVGVHKAKLYDTTGMADLIIGTSERTTVSTVTMASNSLVIGRFTLIVESVLELQHWCGVTLANTGFGFSTSASVVEVYSDVRIWKVA